MAGRVGPTVWSEDELQLAGALNVGPLPLIDINTPIHTLFDRARWEVDDEVYRLLLPSMRLATNLLNLGLPYIASFLPSDPVHMSLKSRYYTEEDEDTGETLPKDFTIPMAEDVDYKTINEARKELEIMTDCIRWQTNNEMLMQHGWLGITRVLDLPRPWGLIDTDQVVTGDEAHEQDTIRRPLILAICEEYVTAIRNSPPDSELHLKATFMAGVTIAHEVGHAIWHQDYRSYDYRDPETDIFDNEPWVGSDAIKEELGNAFIAYIFDSFTPDFCRMTAKEHGESTAPFQNALYWRRHPQIDTGNRELYSTGYAIPISYMQKVLSQSFWAEFGDVTVPPFFEAFGKLIPDKKIKATRSFAEYTVGRRGAAWAHPQVDRRRAVATDLQRLTQAELDWQRKWQDAVRTGGPGPAPLHRPAAPRPSRGRGRGRGTGRGRGRGRGSAPPASGRASGSASKSTQKPSSGRPSRRGHSPTNTQSRASGPKSTGSRRLNPTNVTAYSPDDYYDEDVENARAEVNKNREVIYVEDDTTDDEEESRLVSDEKRSTEARLIKEAELKARIEQEAQEKALAKKEAEQARADELAAAEALAKAELEQRKRLLDNADDNQSDDDEESDDSVPVDDEEEFGYDSGDGTRGSHPHIPSDGIIIANVRPGSFDMLDLVIIDLTIRYRPDVPANTTKRARSSDDDNGSGGGSAKRQRVFGGHIEHFEDRYGKSYDYNNVDQLLLNKSPTTIANWFTRRTAIEYCESPGALGSRLPHNMVAPENNPAWGASRLDEDNPEDRGLIESIRARTFEVAMTRYANPSSKAKLQKALMESVEHWSRAHMDHFLEVHKLPVHTGSQQTLRQKILAQLQNTLDTIEGRISLPRPEPARNSPLPPLRKAADDMTDVELASYFQTWNLPRWGSRIVQEERVSRHREELRDGVADRSGIFRNGNLVIARVADGVELYVCEAQERTTTISQLRDWLFFVAVTPAGSDIDLYIGRDREHPLDVDKTFNHYGDLDDGNVWMVLRRYQGEGSLAGGDNATVESPVFRRPGRHGSSSSRGPSQPHGGNSRSGSGSGAAPPPGRATVGSSGASRGTKITNPVVIDLTSPEVDSAARNFKRSSISPFSNPQELINQMAQTISNIIKPTLSPEDFVNEVTPIVSSLVNSSANPQEVITRIGPALVDIVRASDRPEDAVKRIAAPIIDLVSPTSSSAATPNPIVLPTVNTYLATVMARRSSVASIIQPGGGIDPLRPELQGQVSRSAREILDNVDEAEETNVSIRGGFLADIIAGGQQLPGAGSNGVPVWEDHTPEELLGDEVFSRAVRRVLNQGAPDVGASEVGGGGFGGIRVGQVLGTGAQVEEDEDEEEGPMPGSFMRGVYDGLL